MVGDPPPFPYTELSSLLHVLSHIYPQLFYKPFFSCAASSKEFTIINHLCTLAIHSKYIGDYWNRDAEMICIALLSDVGAEKETMTSMVGNTPWGVARLGQSVLLLELIGKIQAVRRIKESAPVSKLPSSLKQFIFTFVVRDQTLHLWGFPNSLQLWNHG